MANAPVPFFDWTGFYVGGNVGGGQGQVRSSDTVSGTVGGLPTASSGSGSRDVSGFPEAGRLASIISSRRTG